MKKVITVMLIVMLMVMNFLSSVYALTTEVTEDNLEEAILKYNEKSGTNDAKLNKTEKVIELTLDGKTFDVEYNLEGNVQFETNMTFTKDMTVLQIQDESSKSMLPIMPVVFVAMTQGVDELDALAYISDTMLKNAVEQLKKLEDITSSDYSEIENYDDEDLNSAVKIDCDIFTFEMKMLEFTEEKYTMQSVLLIKPEADFSVMNGYLEKLGHDIENSLGGLYDGLLNNAKPESNNNGGSSTVEEPKDANKEETNKTNVMPDAGMNMEASIVLQVIIATAVLILVLMILKSKKNKDMNK